MLTRTGAVLVLSALTFAALLPVSSAAPRSGPAPDPAPAPSGARASVSGDPGPGEEFSVDRAHSTIIYRLRHFGVSNFWGRVNMPDGRFRFDDDDLAASFVNITIELKQMDAGNKSRDRFLMSPDFFNVREYKTADFKSTSIRKLEDGLYEASGNFTMRGVRKPIDVRIESFTTLKTERFGFRGGFECTFTVKRSEYGMGMFVEEGTLGDDVTITAAIEGVVRPEEE